MAYPQGTEGRVPQISGRGTVMQKSPPHLLTHNHNGDQSNLNIYRGITLTPVVSKLFESVLLGLYSEYLITDCLLYTSPSPRDRTRSRMPSSA